MRQAIVIVGHRLNADLIKQYNTILEAFTPYGDTFLILNTDNSEMNFKIDKNIICLSTRMILSMGYIPIEESIIPGSNHFLLLWIYKHFPQYDYYWNVEYDVTFSGYWSYLFKLCENRRAHFLSTHIKHYIEDSDWSWWKSLYGKMSHINIMNRLRSFNPIYRISKEALTLIDHTLMEGSYGHHEVLVPTLLYSNGYSIEDFGGAGSFTPKSFINKIYIQHGQEGTMRYRPIFNREDDFPFENRLFHPVK